MYIGVAGRTAYALAYIGPKRTTTEELWNGRIRYESFSVGANVTSAY